MRQRGLMPFFFLACMGTMCGAAQTASAPAPMQAQSGANRLAEPPGLIYKEAMHPLDVVRTSFGNWSPSELMALSVAIRSARVACGSTSPEVYAGETTDRVRKEWGVK